MSAVSSRVPPNLTTDSAYKYINATPPTAEESLSRAEQKTDQFSRDIAYFDIAASAWRKGNFKLARTANAKISDLEVSRKLALLIDFGEASNLIRLDPGGVNEAQKTAEKMDAGIEKAMLFLSIAKVREKSGDNTLSEEAVDLALKTVSSVSDARRPFLILLAAGQLAAIRSTAAQIVWGNAIKDFNRFDSTDYSKIDWVTPVQFGQLVLPFLLTIYETDLGFGSAFRRALASDPDAALTRADELKNESFRASGYVEIVTVSVGKPPKNRTFGPTSGPEKASEPVKP
jgi:hypothetical protein